MKKTLSALMLMLLISCLCFAAKYPVSTEQEFTLAANKVTAGDEIIIKDGTYDNWHVNLTANGYESKPIIIRAGHKGKVIFTQNTAQPIFSVKGNYNVIDGIVFKECVMSKPAGVLITLTNSLNSRITNCILEKNTAKAQFMPLFIVSGMGQYNQIDHCTFTSNIDVQDIQVRVEKTGCPQFTLISNNLFQNKDKVTWANFNGGECVQIGQDPINSGTIVSNTTVRNNRFIRCNAEPEVISNKCSGNKYIANYFEDCDGELVMRGGHDCVVDSNEFKGGLGGIRLCGTGHTVTNNTISNVKTGIRLYYGMAAGKTDIGFYIAASNCIIKNNRISNTQTGILVGDSKNQDWTGKFNTTTYPSRVMQDVAPANNTITDNTFKNTTNNVLYQ